MKKNVLSLVALLMLLPSTVHAADTPVTNGSGSSSALLTSEVPTFSVTVPMSLPISVGADGTVTVATDAKIVNNSPARVKVTNVAVTGTDGWSVIGFDADMSAYKVNEKKFGFMLNNGKTVGDAYTYTATNFPSLASKNATTTDELAITYNAVVVPQKDAIANQKIADIVFTVDWDTVSPTV